MAASAHGGGGAAATAAGVGGGGGGSGGGGGGGGPAIFPPVPFAYPGSVAGPPGLTAISGGHGGGGATGGPLVTVWEWEDEMGRWRPYSGRVSEHIERSLLQLPLLHGAAAKGAHSISLGQADPWLAPYIIDIPTLTQFRQDTGRMRNIRRQLYSQTSAPAKGILWQWENDEGGWTAYEMHICIFIENSYSARQQIADLGHFGYNYIVDLNSLFQTNKGTGFRRRVQRYPGAQYPLATAGPMHNGQLCSCLQCLANTVTGPMLNRNRHTAYNLAGPSTQQPSSRSSLVASPNHGFSPYIKRPMSMTGMNVAGASWTGAAGTATGLPPTSGSHLTNGSSIPTVPIQLNGPSHVIPAFAGMAAILMCAAGLPACFTRAAKPVSNPDSRKSDKKPSPAKDKSFRRSKKVSKKDVVKDPEEVVRKYMVKLEQRSDEDCIICMEKLSVLSGYDGVPHSKTIQPDSVGKFTKCGHIFHLLCMMAMYENGTKDGSLQCPSCKMIYGEKTGTQPKGKMDLYLLPQSLPGHPDCAAIHIAYYILPGIQGPEHPNPGRPFTARGFPRHCYLPHNDKGRKVLELLKVAWNRRLIFTVGTSNTTGEADTVVWNEIHHKTEMGSNVSGHGYPDPNYLDNVMAELSAQGVTEDCLRQ